MTLKDEIDLDWTKFVRRAKCFYPLARFLKGQSIFINSRNIQEAILYNKTHKEFSKNGIYKY